MRRHLDSTAPIRLPSDRKRKSNPYHLLKANIGGKESRDHHLELQWNSISIQPSCTAVCRTALWDRATERLERIGPGQPFFFDWSKEEIDCCRRA